MSNFKKAIIALFILLLGIPLALFGYTWIKLNSIHVDSKYDSTIEKVDGITNILLTGIDARPGEQGVNIVELAEAGEFGNVIIDGPALCRRCH